MVLLLYLMAVKSFHITLHYAQPESMTCRRRLTLTNVDKSVKGFLKKYEK